MRTLQLNEFVYFLPAGWNEISAEQLLYLVKLVDKQLKPEEIKLKMLLKTLNARVHSYNGAGNEMCYIIKIGKKKYELSAEQVHAVTAIFDYLFFKGNKTVSINPLLTKNPFPVLKVCGKILQGAGEGLHDITYEQFIDMMVCFDQMLAKPECINDFIALIYKSSDEKEIEAKHFGKLPSAVKITIIWYYMGSLQFMAEKFPLTFSGTGGGSSGRNIFENQMRVVDALAGNDLTKKETVKKSLLYDALFTLEIAAENVEKTQK